VSNTAVTIAVVGDLMLQHPLVGSDRSPRTARIWEVLGAADVVVANLEVPLTARETPADKHVAYRADPARAADLRAAGIDVVTLANNHMYDQGEAGMFDTLQALQSAGVAAIGAGRDLAAALAPALVAARGVRVACVGLASTLPVGSGAAPDRPGIAPVRVTTSYVVDGTALDETPGIAPVVETRAWPADVEAACAAVAAARRAADVCVVAIHWGVPNGWVAQFQDPIAAYQRPLARVLVEAGADVIAGHHPHVLHGIEVIGDRPVFYSLGNFLFHSLRVGRGPRLRRTDPPYLWKPLRSKINLDSVIAMVTCDGGRPTTVELVPIILNDTGDPEPTTPEDAVRILGTMAEHSAPLGAQITTDGGRGRLTLGAVEVRR
jgi:poly-gamma-glutamate synthesis protein (capsule biosynthesis protein)